MAESVDSPEERPGRIGGQCLENTYGGEPLRLLFVGNFFRVRGVAAQYCHDLSARLEAAGHAVVRTSPYRSRPARLLDMVRVILARRRDYQVAHVDVFSGPSLVWAATASALLRSLQKPFVLSLHGGNLPAFSARHSGWMGRLLGTATAVTAPSKYLIEKLRPFRADIQWIPNGLDCQWLPFRERHEMKPKLVWVRAFHAIYAPETAIEVLARLRRNEPTASLTMIGLEKDGSLARCHDRAAELGVREYVGLVAGVPHQRIPEYLAQADIFLNTATIDNTPVSVLEAMACGLCVVSTNVAGIPYLLEDGVDGVLVPPRDVAAMVGAIQSLLGEPRRARRISANARSKVEKFDWKNVVPAWEELLARCSRGQSRGERQLPGRVVP